MTQVLTQTTGVGWNRDLDFSPTGDVFALVGSGGAELWDATTRQQRLTLSQPSGAGGVAFSGDGRRVAVAGLDGNTRLYTLDLEELIALGRERATRTLTDVECQRYLHMAGCAARP